MKYTALLSACLLVFSVSCGKTPVPGPEPEAVEPENTEPWGEEGMSGENHVYLTNGKIQIGIDLSRGGAIFHFSTAKDKVNRLNHCDEGRFIQQSYYGSDGQEYLWSGNKWNWNPIQGGGSDGQPARVDSFKSGPNYLKVVTTPRQWGRLASQKSCPLAEDCRMTEYLSLEGNYAVLSFKFEYDGKLDLGTASQELPAFFCDWNFGNLVYYAGDFPWTGGKLTEKTPIVLSGIANPNPAARIKEGWAAYVNDEGYGIGLFSPEAKEMVYYTFGSGPGGAKSGSCSYFAPVRKIHITPGFTINYKAYLTIGTVDEIRQTFTSIHESL